METGQSLLRLTIVCAGALVLFGCHSKSEQQSTTTATAGATGSGEPVSIDHVTLARRMLLTKQWDAAADAAYQALVQDPQDLDATLIAGEAEAARGNHQVAADLASSINIRTSHGRRAVELHYEQLMKLNQPSAAADVILTALKVIGDESEWRHRAWETLNIVGRREEASLQAAALCREGQATEAEMHSLIRRSLSFPLKLAEGETPEEKAAELAKLLHEEAKVI